MRPRPDAHTVLPRMFHGVIAEVARTQVTVRTFPLFWVGWFEVYPSSAESMTTVPLCVGLFTLFENAVSRALAECGPAC